MLDYFLEVLFLLITALMSVQAIFGALRAVYRYVRGTSNWEKTKHLGQHRDLVEVEAVEM